MEFLKQNFKKNRLAYILILPAIVAMLMIHFVPMIEGLYISLLNLNQYTLLKFLHAPFVGFQNFYKILFDPTSTLRIGFLDAVRNTIIYTIVVNFGVLVIGMLLALVLNQEFKGRGIARTMLLLPWVVPSYVVGILWGFMWQQDNGIINKILVNYLHLLSYKPFWLIGSNVIVAIIIPTIWRSFPMTMIMLLAGLQSISSDFYEAAEIDGATGWQKFYYVTLPFLRPVIGTLLLFGMIGSIYSYNIVAMMFGNGSGFPGEWGDLIMTNITRNSFNMWQFGTGAAASVLLMITVLMLTGIWYKIFKDSLTMN
ncbi:MULTISPECIES: carbohydrate ABC transporter permease [Thermoanaerobacterium]|uniref:ABC transporter n=2 Tax=Thermoanaerobacterium TaxID=28895 RepID=W9E9T2_9THEO|nr:MULTISPECIES: sugar ABC transporter permease [Thermoanaerobacterium]AFK87261.1 ABC-type transporter, integral membrane subunit [Thermoanaerobacterium saccharolyticum JW/SL-YS485]ETO37841.1 ABC transporter [Thermoanaerobacterium aotearoense SCUT27]WHE06401.1 sugar ABC transporter permease [Thermoanaerobacterium thermosaccharolyticum]